MVFSCAILSLYEILASFLGIKKQQERKTLADYQRQMLVNMGQQQFKKLRELGLTIPVALS